MECFYGIVKYYLFLTNLLTSLVGIAVVGIGVWLHFTVDGLLGESTDQEQLLYIAVYIFIAFGCIIFLISFCGCCGSISEVRWLLILYSIILFLLGTAKIVIGIIMFSNSETWRSSAEGFVNDAFTDPEYNNTFHVLESYLECCGTVGPNSYTNNTSSLLPPTCCPNSLLSLSDITSQNQNDPISIGDIANCTLNDAFTTGCSIAVGNFVSDIITAIGNIFIWIGVYELVNMLAAIYLCYKIFKKIRKAKEAQPCGNRIFGGMTPQTVLSTSTITVSNVMQ